MDGEDTSTAIDSTTTDIASDTLTESTTSDPEPTASGTISDTSQPCNGSCSGETPQCNAEQECVCTPTSCNSGRFCDTTSGACAACGSGAEHQQHCGTACADCDALGGTCNDAGKCACMGDTDCEAGSYCETGDCLVCTIDTHCGASCVDCGDTPLTPYCDGTACVRCTSDLHCTSPEVCDTDTGECVLELCDGAEVGGGCWYMGSEFQSCTTVCTTHGGYDELTATFAGSNGTNDNCKAVLDALNQPGTSVGNTVPEGNGVGCVYWSGASMRMRQTFPATVADAAATSYRRACACAR